jgi:hypothetical protein
MAGKMELELIELSTLAQQYIQSVIEGLSLGDGQFLLAVVFVTADEVRYHSMFPSVLGVDVVFGTNQEKRPHMRGTCKSSDNKNVPVFNAFLPSQQKWVFEWVMTDALPSLLDPEAFLSDQDPQLCGSVDKVIISRDKLYDDAMWMRECIWHNVTNIIIDQCAQYHFMIQS